MPKYDEITCLRLQLYEINELLNDNSDRLRVSFASKEMITHEQLLREREKLKTNQLLLMDKIREALKELVIGNDNLDIYSTCCENIYTQYDICIHGIKTKIGSIEFRKKDVVYGDIGYYINEEYQGHGYAYEATCLLLKFLFQNGIKDVKIRAFISNIPSIKTIEKLGTNGLTLDRTVEDNYQDRISRSYYYSLEREKVYALVDNLPVRNTKIL